MSCTKTTANVDGRTYIAWFTYDIPISVTDLISLKVYLVLFYSSMRNITILVLSFCLLKKLHYQLNLRKVL